MWDWELGNSSKTSMELAKILNEMLLNKFQHAKLK